MFTLTRNHGYKSEIKRYNLPYSTVILKIKGIFSMQLTAFWSLEITEINWKSTDFEISYMIAGSVSNCWIRMDTYFMIKYLRIAYR